MRVRPSIKKIDQDDQITKGSGRLYEINKKKPLNKAPRLSLLSYKYLFFGIISFSF